MRTAIWDIFDPASKKKRQVQLSFSLTIEAESIEQKPDIRMLIEKNLNQMINTYDMPESNIEKIYQLRTKDLLTKIFDELKNTKIII